MVQCRYYGLCLKRQAKILTKGQTEAVLAYLTATR
jgi:hypothetical protein